MQRCDGKNIVVAGGSAGHRTSSGLDVIDRGGSAVVYLANFDQSNERSANDDLQQTL